MMMLTYISLFSGVGGFDLGFDRAGMACLAQVEFNPKASDVLKHHWPNIKRFKDVRDVGKHNLTTPDVLCGGFPCQDVSVAGKREGLAGKRSGLWFEFHRIITELKPRFVIIENVPGLLSSNDGRDFAIVLGGLTGIIPAIPRGGWKKAGLTSGYPELYKVAWRVLDSKHFDIAQRRERVFIVASLRDGSCAQILFEPTGSSRDIAPSGEAGKAITINLVKSASIGHNHRAEYASSQNTSDLSYSAEDTTQIPAYVGTLAASGAGTARPAGQANELDFLIPTKHRAFNVTFCDANGRRKDRLNGGLYVNETDKANTLTQGAIDHTLVAQAVDVRSLAMGSEVSGTLQAKKSGGWSLSYINPVLTEKPDRIKEWVETDDRIRAVQNDGHSSTAQEHVYFKPNAVINSLEASRPHQIIAPIAYGIRTDITPKWLENTAPTLLTPSKSGGGHPPEVVTPALAVRRLTPTECERLQGFPDGHTAVNSQADGTRYTQMGNAVTVNVAEWIGQRIVAVEWARLTGLAVQS